MHEVNASIITIGDELLIGQTIDTNSAFIAQELNSIGIWVKRRVAVGDDRQEILQTLEAESWHASVIIITGGLGPTGDDITKPALCSFFGSKLVVNEEALQNVISIFTKLNKPVTDMNRKQAEVPDNCTVLQNSRGTAPGLWFEKEHVIFVSLPGVPHEMKGLMIQTVLPKLQSRLLLPVIMHKTLLTAGKGESEIAGLLSSFESSLPLHIKLAYLPSYGTVRLRLTARGIDSASLSLEIDQFFLDMKHRVHSYVVAEEDTSLSHSLLKLLKEKNRTLATAESCTGGYLAHLITSVAGSSAVYKGSIVAYANAVKEKLLNVSAGILKQHGAVSEQTVLEMAKAAREKLNTNYAIATSGIMGPDGGTEEKPVGTVWIAVAGEKYSRAQKFFFRFDRSRNIELAANNGLLFLRRFILEQEDERD